MAVEPNPTVARRLLAVYFSTLREQRKRGLPDLAKALGVALSQASRLDTGARGFQLVDVETLCDWYEIGSAEQDRLMALAEESRRRAWWQQVVLEDSYRTLIGMERAAVTINEYCSTVIPGLLQTSGYANAAVASSAVGERASDVDQAVDVRMHRQDILERSDPPELSVVLDEAALARGAGGPSVMRGQLEHLLEMAKRPEITIQVIGFDAGMYPIGAGQFILLRMGRGVPDVYYSESQLGPSDSSDLDQLKTGWRLWNTLQGAAMSAQLSAERIEQYLSRLRN